MSNLWRCSSLLPLQVTASFLCPQPPVPGEVYDLPDGLAAGGLLAAPHLLQKLPAGRRGRRHHVRHQWHQQPWLHRAEQEGEAGHWQAETGRRYGAPQLGPSRCRRPHFSLLRLSPRATPTPPEPYIPSSTLQQRRAAVAVTACGWTGSRVCRRLSWCPHPTSPPPSWETPSGYGQRTATWGCTPCPLSSHSHSSSTLTPSRLNSNTTTKHQWTTSMQDLPWLLHPSSAIPLFKPTFEWPVSI